MPVVALPTTADYREVMVTTVTLEVADGGVPAALYRPPGDRPCPAIAIGAEAYGPNDFSRRVAATLAHLGYVTIVPDYYRGKGPADVDNYADFTAVIEHIETLDFGRATHDLMAALDHLRELPFVDRDRLAVWGYCTGGTLALLTAALWRDLAAAVLFFPSQPVFEELNAKRPVQPFDLLWNISCPVLLIYGDEDPVMPPERLADLRSRLAQGRVDHTIKLYPGAGHSFSAPTPPLRHDAADRAAWADALSFVEERLSKPRTTTKAVGEGSSSRTVKT